VEKAAGKEQIEAPIKRHNSFESRAGISDEESTSSSIKRAPASSSGSGPKASQRGRDLNVCVEALLKKNKSLYSAKPGKRPAQETFEAASRLRKNKDQSKILI